MTSSVKKLVTLVVFLFTILSLAAFAKKPRLVVKLVHRNSLQSPDYSIASNDQANLEFESSAARFAYLNDDKSDDYKAGLVPSNGGFNFMANISVGDPPVPQLLLMDTGSALLWFQCLPCTKCYKQPIPIFDPSKSKTYTDLRCSTRRCPTCETYVCPYKQFYVDKTGSTGTLASEKLTFETSDDGIIAIPNILIGCGHENVNSDSQYSGILGLSPETIISMVYDFNSTFSYCLGNINDPSYEYNSLILGNGAIMEGKPSPLDLYNGGYYVSLEAISVGKKLLKINPDVFKRSPDTGVGGMIIDSGTTYTFLPREAFLPLIDELQPLLSRKLTPVLLEDNTLCYKGTIKDVPKPFPLVTLHFAGGAEIVLDVDTLFFQYSDSYYGQFCLSLAESPQIVTNIKIAGFIGIKTQQNYNVGYDLVKKTISFTRIDCRLLVD